MECKGKDTRTQPGCQNAGCSDCKRAKKFLGEQRVHFEWVDVELSAEGLALVERVNRGMRIIPTIVFGDGSLLVEPSNAELAAKLGLQTMARMSYYDLIVVDKVTNSPKIEVRYNTEVTELHGEAKLTGITVRNRVSGATEVLDPAGVFVFIGLLPNSAWLPPDIQRDNTGFIVTDSELETSLPGDVRLGSTKQAASAVGEGATAALMIREYLKTV